MPTACDHRGRRGMDRWLLCRSSWFASLLNERPGAMKEHLHGLHALDPHSRTKSGLPENDLAGTFHPGVSAERVSVGADYQVGLDMAAAQHVAKRQTLV